MFQRVGEEFGGDQDHQQHAEQFEDEGQHACSSRQVERRMGWCITVKLPAGVVPMTTHLPGRCGDHVVKGLARLVCWRRHGLKSVYDLLRVGITALRTAEKCSFTIRKLRFLRCSRLVLL
ncbi:hypothetical protein N7403_24760 [Pseudomonas nitroreducens]|uniref:hypothetical protein n=1 Tax=Pseudomonas nitroreducens TaxID=46680 RepID=UPI002448A72C|nr:hypothetical protein [Pseudomonas nitroreducens]MDG9857073.1 hypothetical protein [Pseudomonas nitroreducens]